MISEEINVIAESKIRDIVKNIIIIERDSGGGTAYAGALGIPVPTGTGESSSATKQAIEAEIKNTTAQINAITGEDSASQSKKEVLQSQLRDMQDKLAQLTA